jgi:hypothetical protein
MEGCSLDQNVGSDGRMMPLRTSHSVPPSAAVPLSRPSKAGVEASGEAGVHTNPGHWPLRLLANAEQYPIRTNSSLVFAKCLTLKSSPDCTIKTVGTINIDSPSTEILLPLFLVCIILCVSC